LQSEQPSTSASHHLTRLLDTKYRFLLPPVAITVARLILAEAECLSLKCLSLEYVFYPRPGQDAFYNLVIISLGYIPYVHQVWTILPSYPILIRLILVPWLGAVPRYSIAESQLQITAAVAASWSIAAVSIPIFQSIAERTMSRIEAINCTLLMFFFPEIFVFSSLEIPGRNHR